MVTTIVVPNSIVLTTSKVGFVTGASDIIQLDWTASSSKVRRLPAWVNTRESKLSASHLCLFTSPIVVTNGAPFTSVERYFQSALMASFTTNKPKICIGHKITGTYRVVACQTCT